MGQDEAGSGDEEDTDNRGIGEDGVDYEDELESEEPGEAEGGEEGGEYCKGKGKDGYKGEDEGEEEHGDENASDDDGAGGQFGVAFTHVYYSPNIISLGRSAQEEEEVSVCWCR